MQMTSIPHFRFTVEGMMCQKNCASTVQKSLESVNGVKAVTVTFSRKLAEIWMNTKDLNMECEKELVNAIEDMGFDAKCISRPSPTDFPANYKFIVEGMMCQKNCGTTVQKCLENINGVRIAKVTFSTKLAEVWLETNDMDNKVSEKELINAIEDIGFEARSITNNNMNDNKENDDDDMTERPDIELIVKGMLHPITCPAKINSLIHKIDGVISVQVNYQEKLVSIYGFAEINNIIDILLKHGYYANNKNQKLKYKLDEHQKNKRHMNHHPTTNNNNENNGYNTLSNKSEDSSILYNDFLELKIQGMSCANCSKGIEKEISPLPGIQSIKIALLAEKAEIIFDAKIISIEKIIHLINEMGYEATAMMSKNKNEPNKKIYTFVVIGMSCTSCMTKIENSIYNIFSRKYIDNVNISLLTNKLVVTVSHNRHSNNNNNTSTSSSSSQSSSSSISGSNNETKDGDNNLHQSLSSARANDSNGMNITSLNNNTTSSSSSIMTTNTSAMMIIEDNPPGPRDILDHIIALGYSCRFISSFSSSSSSSSGTATPGTVKNNYGVSYGNGNMNDDENESFCVSITPCSSTPTAEQTELQVWGKLLFIAAILGVPVIFIHSIGHHIPPLEMILMEPNSLICHGALSIGQTVLICLNVPIQFVVGYKFYRSAWLGAIHYNFGMDFLIVLGTTITFIYSVLTVIYACVTPSIHSIKHLFFDASGMLFLFVTLGKFLEAYAKGKTVSAISSLLKLQPQQATIVEVNHHIEDISNQRRRKSLQNGITATTTATNNTSTDSTTTDADDNTSSSPLTSSPAVNVLSPNAVAVTKNAMSNEVLRHVDIGLVQKGDILKVLPGARVPTDGVILSGSSALDESMITGESVPVLKSQNEFIFGSTINITNVLYMEVTAVYEENALSQIISLVESAQLNKAPIQAYADRMASLFTPFVVSIALITFFGWYVCCIIEIVPSLWYEEEFGNPLLFSMLFGISVVVISCPCALGLATPTAIMVGTSLGATNGVLIKGGPAFEMAHKIKTIVFDKTGTLTLGKPNLTNIVVIHYNDDSNNIYVHKKNDDDGYGNNNNDGDIDDGEEKHVNDHPSTRSLPLSLPLLPPPTLLNTLDKKLRSYNFDFQDDDINNNVNEAVIQFIEKDEVDLELIEMMKTRILMLAATVEQGSQHPLAQAILNAAIKKSIPLYTLELDDDNNNDDNNHNHTTAAKMATNTNNTLPSPSPLQPSKKGGFKVINGMGVECNTPEGRVLIGNRIFMESAPHSIIIDPVIDHAMWQIESQGKTAVCVALESKILGVLGIADTLKPDAIATIAALRLMNIDVWMVTGDNHTTAYAIAEELDIPQNRVMAGVLPAEKVSKILQLQNPLDDDEYGDSSINDTNMTNSNTKTKSQLRRGGIDTNNKSNGSSRRNSGNNNYSSVSVTSSSNNLSNTSHRQYVAMVGDGINDSPALAQADLGIAVGAGTQVAIEAADMVLIRDCLSDVVVALDLAKFVFQRIRINFLWAVVYNFIAIPVAAGVWYPWTHMLVSPQYAGLAMAFSSTSVVISSLALRLYSRPNHLFESSSHQHPPSTSLPLPKKKKQMIMNGRNESNISHNENKMISNIDVPSSMMTSQQVILKKNSNSVISNINRDAVVKLIQPSSSSSSSGSNGWDTDYSQLPVEEGSDGIQLLDANTVYSNII